MSEFDDIRPYNDDEVRPTLLRLFDDKEFLDAIVRLKFPLLSRLAAPLARPIARATLRKELAGVLTIADFQAKIERYMQQNIESTTTSLSFSGLEHLKADKAYLFISNHRDIAMDPAFVNWALFKGGFQTLRVAIGDNLLTKPFAGDLMRLNKCFIVNRSATAPREKLKAAKLLSSYIHHSLCIDNANIWIAQREGRAKDSRDITNPAIVSMLVLNKPKGDDFGEYIKNLNIVPVSISYEYDPCDQAKARELTMRAENGHYEKTEHEDVNSIALGIAGQKGGVHVAFGAPLGAQFASVEAVAAELNRQIASNYMLHSSNCIAYTIVTGEQPKVTLGAQQKPYAQADYLAHKTDFDNRLRHCPAPWRERFISIYANPVVAKLAHQAAYTDAHNAE
ncbi:MAG: 1-acyl-sn-glycerol-3-phosphate acyltransferase [Marinagarivorans sp.]|nr:1-acyl-sn-glycerol-3-phosphate acyltransferase [Marinagarivorans sp.]